MPEKNIVFVDTHVHVKPDGAHKNFVDLSMLQETLKTRGLSGCIATMHSAKKFYETDFEKIKEYCEGYPNIIPAVEITQPFTFNNTSIECHVMYLGNIPAGDIEYGSWFCHVEKTGGLFFQYEKKNLNVEKALQRNQVRIVESTTDLFTACSLKLRGLTALLGSDIHPGCKNFYSNYLGSKGIIIQADKFSYQTFMAALKENSFGYFSIIGQNYYYCMPQDFKQKKIIINRDSYPKTEKEKWL